MNYDENEIDDSLTSAVLSINVSDEQQIEFKEEIEKDPTLKCLKQYSLNGWPRNKAKCANEAKSFFKNRHEIYLDDDILFLNERIMVPMTMKNKILKQLHESHFGITKTKKRAKNALYWHGLDDDIEKMISACNIC